MNVYAILLLGLLAAPVAAGAAWVAGKVCPHWTPRQLVFNSAAIAPSLIAAGSACFAIVILTLGDARKFEGADNFLIQAITTVLVAFAAGMVSAFLVERAARP